MTFLHDDHGNALIELALILPLFCLILLGTVNYSLRIQQAMQVTSAATAGAAYGLIPGNQADLTGMQNAATSAASGVANMTVTASQLWTCAPGGSSVLSSSTCSSYGTPIQYVQVHTSASVPALFAWPGLSSAMTVQQTVTYRVPWTP